MFELSMFIQTGFVCALLAGVSTRSYSGSEKDIVVTDLGVKIEKISRVAKIEREILVSVLIKLPSISNISFTDIMDSEVKNTHWRCIQDQRGFTVEENRGKQFAKSHLNRSDENYGLDFKTKWQEMTNHYHDIINDYIKERREILKPFITRIEHTNSRKRNVLGFIAGGAMSLLLGGISEVQIYKLNQHVHENSEAIQSIKRAILAQQTEITMVNDKVTGFVKDITKDIKNMFYQQTCQQFYSSLSIVIKNKIDESMSEIDDTLWTAISGQNFLSLTPRMIGIHMLKQIVSWNSILNSTIYNKEPSFLYSLASVSLIELSDKLDFAHFVLQIPVIMESSITDLYKTRQVGIYKDSHCIYQEIPTHMYKETHFKSMSLNNCKRHDNLFACTAENFSNETSCLQAHYSNCSLVKQDCKLHYQFEMSYIGCLMRNNLANNTFATNNQGFTYNVKFSNFRTAYLYWKDITYLQIGNKRILSPSSRNMTLTLKMSNISLSDTDLDWHIDMKNVTETFTNICKTYSTSLEDLLSPIVDHWQSPIKSNMSLIWQSFLTILVALLIGNVVYINYKLVLIYKSGVLVEQLSKNSSSQSIPLVDAATEDTCL